MREDILYKPLSVAPEVIVDIIEAEQLYAVIGTACKLGIFNKLRHRCEIGEMTQELRLDEKTLAYLLEVFVQAGLVESEAGCYQNTQLGNMYFVQSSFLYMGHNFVTGPAHTIEVQLTNNLIHAADQAPSPEPDWNPERLRQIGVSGLLGSIQTAVAAVALHGARRLLDLGGGHGFYSIAFAQRCADLKVVLYDLPRVVPLARKFVGEFGLEGRIQVAGGDFLTESIGNDYDVILCANILHRDKRDIVLPKVYAALNPGGRIIVKCRVADGEESLSAALARLLWWIQGGRELLSRRQWRDILVRYGFVDVRTMAIDGIFATITGCKQESGGLKG